MSWIDDGSCAVTSDPQHDATFVVQGKELGDAPVNARWSEPLSLSGTSYFEVTVEELASNAKVGIATEAHFKKGYAMKGLFFNGNLTDGSAGLQFGFGEVIQTGMVIGVRVDLETEKVTVIFYQDGRCLGPGFISKREAQDALVYPVVSAGHDGDRFSIKFPLPVPLQLERQPLREEKDLFLGKWLLKSLFLGPELGEFPLASRAPGLKMILVVMQDPSHPPFTSSYRMSIQIGNTLMFTGKALEDESVRPFQKLILAPVGSTRMLPSTAINEVESQVKKALSEFNEPTPGKWLLQEDGDMLLVNGATIEMSFSRSDPGSPETEATLP